MREAQEAKKCSRKVLEAEAKRGMLQDLNRDAHWLSVNRHLKVLSQDRIREQDSLAPRYTVRDVDSEPINLWGGRGGDRLGSSLVLPVTVM